MTSSAAPAPAARLVIVADTREQTPWRFSAAVRVERGTIPTGADYTVRGFEDVIGIERKSLGDLVGCLTFGRDRFTRSLEALRSRPWRAVIVEATLADLLAHNYRSQAHPSALLGSVAAIVADGVPVFFAGAPAVAAVFAERLLLKYASRARAAAEAAEKGAA